MGWRVWDAYQQDTEERRRALPWRERFNWRGLVIFAVVIALASLYLWGR